jgi:hypothetical protein
VGSHIGFEAVNITRIIISEILSYWK